MLYIIPAVYLCSTGVCLTFIQKKTRLKIRPKFEYGFNFQISEQSMLLVCRDYCGATPLLLHNISLLYVQTLSNNGATGPHYRFPLQGVLLYQDRYQKSRQIKTLQSV